MEEQQKPTNQLHQLLLAVGARIKATAAASAAGTPPDQMVAKSFAVSASSITKQLQSRVRVIQQRRGVLLPARSKTCC